MKSWSGSLLSSWNRGVVALSAALWLVACSHPGSTGSSSSTSAKNEPANSASPLRVRLMTGKQYSLTLAYLFGRDISESVAPPLPPLARTDGLLANGAASIGITSDQLQQIQQTASAVASKVVDEDHRAFLIPCKPASQTAADTACATQFLNQTGRLWFRHPLDKPRLQEFVKAADMAAGRLNDFYEGLGVALEGMLISPDALFIVDQSEPDPDHKGRQRLDSYSLASRLSFFLWNAAPDDALLTAAEKGDLYTDKGRAKAVDAMLASPRLEDGVRAFFDDMMGFNDFDALSKDPVIYPVVTGATLADAREQTLRTIVDHLVTKKLDYRDLFTTRDTFMSMNLAALYGVPTVSGWVPYRFPSDDPRAAGVLTQVSFLAAHAHPARSSVTRRGKALREVFLCQIVPSPPPNVDFSKLDDPDPSLRTARERLKVHATNASCAGCHRIMDPIGLALEHFDGAGAYRETEKGAPLDTSGSLDGKPFTDVRGLAKALHDHPGVPSCLVNRVYSYGTGGPLTLGKDKPILNYFTAGFAKSGYRLPDLLREIAMSRAFTEVRPVKAATPATTTAAAGTGKAQVLVSQN